MNKLGDKDFSCMPPKSNAIQLELLESLSELLDGTFDAEGWALGVVGETWFKLAEFCFGVDMRLDGSRMAIAEDCWPRWAKAAALALWWGEEEDLIAYL